MTTKQKPATPLPWRVGDAGQTLFAPDAPKPVKGGDNMRYAAHAANAYPRLVEALRCMIEWESMMRDRFGGKYPLDMRPSPNVRAVDARDLLRELGED